MTLNVRDAARLLDVSEKTIYRWISQQKLPASRVGDQYRLNKAELLEWATTNQVKVSPKIFQEDGLDQVVSLEEGLRAGGVFYRVGGKDKESVIKEVVQIMPLPEEVDRAYLLEVLLARESLGSTGIGEGIAIPACEKSNRDAHSQTDGLTLLSRISDRIRCHRPQTGSHFVRNRQSCDQSASETAFRVGLCTARSGIRFHHQPARHERRSLRGRETN